MFDKKFREDFTRGLTDGIKVPLMNVANIDEFCEGLELFFQESQNDYWVNRLDAGIYSLEHGANEELFLILITPGLVQFRVKQEFNQIPQNIYSQMAGGALGVFTFVNVYNGDIDFDELVPEIKKEKKDKGVITKEYEKYMKTRTKKIKQDNGEVWVLKHV